jgi:hypothetical protein
VEKKCGKNLLLIKSVCIVELGEERETSSSEEELHSKRISM